ncbi:MAG: M48 family metallopeptidase [Acinetobacter sp.]|jgi:Zn-dependent protease with chaperone function|uniref:M48 family metallopeptidase n=1 Tax=Acinetobacter albensis TaxID=1673609 RepID=A0A1C4GWP3_9GAMM|nr:MULTISPECIES: M48 family metallopeptidase [Acinetobacter]ALD01302.1 type I deoxyribonuclease HsdR [Acinetobacter sp. TTH0-4]MBE9400974.1 M48 family metallopeptidase [Acinetobacter albensis]QPF38886.1 M48 family metallopeptidase [Acinetobacter sp. TTH0-4]SCC72637.1 Zn-dependent protease with chaperone function [Acinetobacter albensis]
MNNKLILSLCVAGIVTISGCTTVADMAGADSATLNVAAAQGFNKTIQEASANKTLDTSSATYRRINSVFSRLKPYGDQINQTGQKFNWQLAVLKSDQVNAYVAPGGKVVFYTGIVNKLNLTDAEIAAVMGHEMVHALEEHSKNKIGAQALTNLALNIGLSAAGNNVGQLGAAAAQLGSQVGVGLPYSRSLESQADQGGLLLMARAGYNPQAAITLWEKMNKLDGAGGSSFLSTHPSNSQRIEAMRKNLPAAQAIYNKR